jgi:hypothetical protein
VSTTLIQSKRTRSSCHGHLMGSMQQSQHMRCCKKGQLNLQLNLRHGIPTLDLGSSSTPRDTRSYSGLLCLSARRRHGGSHSHIHPVCACKTDLDAVLSHSEYPVPAPTVTCTLKDWWLRSRKAFSIKTWRNFDALCDVLQLESVEK